MEAQIKVANAVADFWYDQTATYEALGNINFSLVCAGEAHIGYEVALKLASEEEKHEIEYSLSLLPKDKGDISKLSPGDKLVFARYCLEQGLNYDEKKLEDQAKGLYLKSIALYIEASKYKTTTSEQASKYRKNAAMMLSRVEKLSGAEPKSIAPKPAQFVQQIVQGGNILAGLSRQELEVVRGSSKMNGQIFLPFHAPTVAKEQFLFPGDDPWMDPMPKLQMSPEQRRIFHHWERGSKYFSENGKSIPKMITAVSPVHIKQENVTDCSFVSSLCVAANYERRIRKQLITGLIYPKDQRGIPIFNPCGKYMVKLWFNGIPRKVLVDDYLPVAKNGTLLCSFSGLRNELWVSIIEKAYMKVNGGYDFPGSNSGIDLYSLTGWIPQAHHTKNITSVEEQQRIWQEIHTAHESGRALLTVSSPSLSHEQEKQLGLVSSHAYAILNTLEVVVDGRLYQLLQIKNPWGSKSWAGKLSGAVFAAVKAKLRNATMNEKTSKEAGIFWMEFPTLVKHFEALYLNWDPASFPNRMVLHRHWRSYGPANDSIILAHNPQFKLTTHIQSSMRVGNQTRTYSQGVVWILLSRHVTHKSQILSHNKRDFLTIHVYDRRNGELVLYPGKSLISGVYSNNPHVLCRLNIPTNGASIQKHFTLVVSAYEKDSMNTGLSYSLTVYSTENCSPQPTVSQIQNRLKYAETLRSRWSTGDGVEMYNNTFTAGGSMNDLKSYLANPMFRVAIHLPCKLRVRLLTFKGLHCNLTAYAADSRKEVHPKKILANSGDYKKGFVYIEFDIPEASNLILVPSTFDKGQTGEIILELECSEKFNVKTA